jgi:serine/threonine protein kinase
MYLGERYQVDTTEHSILRIPEGQQPAKPLFPGAIGVGRNAVVYRGIDTQTGKAVAIKVLLDAIDVKSVMRFQHQAKIAMKLQHPNIVQVYDFGQFDGNYFIVMELVEGTNIRTYRFSLHTERAITIAYNVALGLGAAHDNSIVHANVNPQNILVRLPGTVKITSFYGRSFDRDYYSPEQVSGGILTPASDVYSLGAVLYELVAGNPPFNRGDSYDDVIMQRLYKMPPPPSQPDPPAQFYGNIPQALENIIMRCLETSPDKRYQNASELAHALQELAS